VRQRPPPPRRDHDVAVPHPRATFLVDGHAQRSTGHGDDVHGLRGRAQGEDHQDREPCRPGSECAAAVTV
jgi:hypothetical protein